MVTGHVQELRFQDPNRNSFKFYRLYTVSNGEHYLVRNWGRWGTSGQFKVELHSSAYAAARAGDRIADEKMFKGYDLLRNEDLPVVPSDILELIDKHDPSAAAKRRQTSQTPVQPAISEWDQFTADADRLIRLISSSPDVTAEALALHGELSTKLGDIRERMTTAENQMELINSVITVKATT